MEQIVDKYNIRIGKSLQSKGLYNLNDIVDKIIVSKSPKSYIAKIQNKIKCGKYFFISKDNFSDILKKGKSNICKDAYKILNPDLTKKTTKTLSPQPPTETIVDLNNNNLLFEGNNITMIKKEDEIWFKGKDITTILEYENTKEAISVNVDDEDMIKYIDFKGGLKSPP